MPQHVIIDGNNLLYAMRAHAPVPNIARETLVRVVERWARRGDDEVTIVFDGPTPRGGLARQMTSSRLTVRFSAAVTADDIIVAMVARARDPAAVRVVSGDKAILHAAGYRRCVRTNAVAFVDELVGNTARGLTRSAPSTRAAPGEKPAAPSAGETDGWLSEFGFDGVDDEPFDGAGAMQR